MIAQNVAERAREMASHGTSQATTSNNHLIRRRALECFAITLIGDGALAFVEPTRHVQLWLRGPSWWRKMLEPFVERPQLTRWVGAAELAFGIWLATQQEPEL